MDDLIMGFLEQEKKNSSQQDHYRNGLLIEDNREVPDRFSPIFRSKIERVNTGICFVLMPFSEDWSKRVYDLLIKKNVEAMGLQCLRADNLNGPIVIEDIWTQINQAGIIIADVTHKNANVMYELGIVHTLGKPAVLITQEIDKIPFDFSHLRHYPYKDNAESFNSFGVELKEIIIDIYKNIYPSHPL